MNQHDLDPEVHDLVSVTVRFDILVPKGTDISGLFTEIDPNSIAFYSYDGVQGSPISQGFIGHETERVERGDCV